MNDRNLLGTFEMEFGRLFTPFEFQQMIGWEEQYGEEMTLQALKEAVLAGKRNIRYIDRILFNWEKAGIKTKNEAIEYSNKFRERAFGAVKKNEAAEKENKRKVPEFYNWLEEDKQE